MHPIIWILFAVAAGACSIAASSFGPSTLSADNTLLIEALELLYWLFTRICLIQATLFSQDLGMV
ncbi:hypothetical protein DER44DRAFT_135822 [Fusarium oxysporum]|nr:hypothetical protein DER44DRAFT_135822 [Fusarium oxysporum]